MRYVDIRKQGSVAIVSFDRGTPGNPLSLELMRDLTEVARSFEGDHNKSAVILTGRHNNFCLGFDLKDTETRALRTASLSERRQAFMVGQRLCQAWEQVEPLTISAIEGWCVGGGVALSVATDLRVVSARSVIYVPEIERGLNMSWGSVPRIANLVGPARAKRMIILAEKMNADRAVDWGFADEVAEDGETLNSAIAMADRASSMPPVALRMCKRAVNAYVNALADVATHADYDQFALAFDSDDGQEGINSFFEKRDPKFSRH